LYCVYNYVCAALLRNKDIHGNPKSKLLYYCNNLVYCQPNFIICGQYTLQEIIIWGYLVSPPESWLAGSRQSYCDNKIAYF